MESCVSGAFGGGETLRVWGVMPDTVGGIKSEERSIIEPLALRLWAGPILRASPGF